MTNLHVDEHWPRAGHWLSSGSSAEHTDMTVVGIGAHLTSLTPTGADKTPAAIREAMYKYSTYSWEHDLDIASVSVRDVGDIPDPDWEEGEARVFAKMAELRGNQDLLVALGGDNAITYSVGKGLWADEIGKAGLITIDAHHDIREGISNGSPVRRLIAAGLQGTHIVQIGISDYANSAEYAKRAKEYGITVITRGAMRTRPLEDIMAEAIHIAGASGGPIHYDLDVDVCDRAVTPACPAATPGGLSADDVRHLTFLATSHSNVTSMDITEIDATIDSKDERTIRLGALCVLEAAAGVASRSN
ncbi:MAG: arginase family protein [Actinomycetes bacterium]|jgi:formiminoglutamase